MANVVRKYVKPYVIGHSDQLLQNKFFDLIIPSGQRGLESGLPLVFWAPRQLLLNKFFDLSTLDFDQSNGKNVYLRFLFQKLNLLREKF